MIDRWLLAALHLMALLIGATALWSRARTLKALDVHFAHGGPPDRSDDALRRAFAAEAAWMLAALVWICTGLARAHGPYEKGPAYYKENPLFWTKMGLFVLLLVLECWPLAALLRWRRAARTRQLINPRPARWLARISYAQVMLVALMVLCASAMARGLGAMVAGR